MVDCPFDYLRDSGGVGAPIDSSRGLLEFEVQEGAVFVGSLPVWAAVHDSLHEFSVVAFSKVVLIKG